MCGKCTIQMAFKKPNTKEKKCLIKFLINYFFFFDLLWGMWKFLGEGSNSSHGSDPSHSSDNTKSLPAEPPGNSKLHVEIIIFWICQGLFNHFHLTF